MVGTEHQTGQATQSALQADSGLYEIVRSEDGGYRIAFNGVVLDIFRWRADQLQECVQALSRLADERPSRCR